jgi:hypothetical protein
MNKLNNFIRFGLATVSVVSIASLLSACAAVNPPNDLLGGQSLDKAAVTSTVSNAGVYKSITIEPVGLSPDMKVGERVQFMAYGWTPQNTFREVNSGSNGTSLATWTSSNPSIAYVNAWGSVVGVSPGTVTLKASLYGLTSNVLSITVG